MGIVMRPNRYIAVQKYSEALDLLQEGALIQLKHGQVTCGAELAVLFVETLLKGKIPYSEETLDRLRKIYQHFPKIPLPQKLLDDDDDDMQKLSEALMAAKVRVESCSSFLKAAIRWSAQFGAHKNGSAQLHYMLAEYLYFESPELDIIKVSSHFVRGSNPKKFASTLVNFMGKCYPGEDDAAIARAVLLYLSQGNLRDANYLTDELKKQLESQQFDFPRSDLTQFIEYLLQTLERDAFPLLKILRQKYKSSINREPLFDELLDEIAEKFYGVRRRSGLQGIFGDLFKMM
ncbi:Golgi to ER traffic protein 4 homolog isoform X2 [Phoenix dactylifera]|uniref:Golgi to ER traffic protein 4 homolog isoform X2 n=1 Tax=Phoenix dactylifera TaxID=42345 RepID=A0A8B7MWT8_PHODC|nr:Golgi to ER traffic protein 4 homolog isoform X2 [Phoenix dactylifera]